MSAGNIFYQAGESFYNEPVNFDHFLEFPVECTSSGLDDSLDLPSNFFAPVDFPDITSYNEPPVDPLEDSNAPTDPFGLTPLMAPDLPGYGDSFDFSNGAQDDTQYTDWISSIRQMVEMQAAADRSCLSPKAKRRDASIAIHLQRLQEPQTCCEIPSDRRAGSLYPFSDFIEWNYTPASAQEDSMATPGISTGSSFSTSPEPDVPGPGVELVLDLNMNIAANPPKKQKPRSQAQKESYIKARKYGACEKHRKQHKRCNCLDKDASRIALHVAKTEVAAQLEVPRLWTSPAVDLHLQMPSTQPKTILKDFTSSSMIAHAGAIKETRLSRPGLLLQDRTDPLGPLVPKHALSDVEVHRLQTCHPFENAQNLNGMATDTSPGYDVRVEGSMHLDQLRHTQSSRSSPSIRSTNTSTASRRRSEGSISLDQHQHMQSDRSGIRSTSLYMGLGLRCRFDPISSTFVLHQTPGKTAACNWSQQEKLYVGCRPTLYSYLSRTLQLLGATAVRCLAAHVTAAASWPLIALRSRWKALSTIVFIGSSIAELAFAYCKRHLAVTKRLGTYL